MFVHKTSLDPTEHSPSWEYRLQKMVGCGSLHPSRVGTKGVCKQRESLYWGGEKGAQSCARRWLNADGAQLRITSPG